MQILIKIFVIILTILLSLIIFMPKKEFYFAMEKRVLKSEIIISDEKIEDNLFSLDIKKGNIYYQDVKSASFDKIAIKPYLLYNRVIIRNFKPDTGFSDIIPVSFYKATLIYTPFLFDKIDISMKGNFGEAEGYFDILEKRLKLYIKPKEKSKAFSLLKRFIKKTEEGWIYEKKF